ncbi:MAG: hypothetical protein WBR14_00755, partial [Candidatus Acidiferrum sp.]
FQHPDDLLFAKATPFHDASPLAVLYTEKLSFGWTKFRGAGQQLALASESESAVTTREWIYEERTPQSLSTGHGLR